MSKSDKRPELIPRSCHHSTSKTRMHCIWSLPKELKAIRNSRDGSCLILRSLRTALARATYMLYQPQCKWQVKWGDLLSNLGLLSNSFFLFIQDFRNSFVRVGSWMVTFIVEESLIPAPWVGVGDLGTIVGGWVG